MSDYGRLFKAVRGVVRWFTPQYRIRTDHDLPTPSVMLCRHNNLNGPRIVMTWLPHAVRTWVFHVFMDRVTCYRHYVGYTFTQRFRWSTWKAAFAARMLTPFVVNVLDSMRAIPVYRNSIESFKTIKETLRALLSGEQVLIFPDVNYTSTDKEVRSIYEGFLYLERYYYSKTGKHLPFIPIYLDHDRKEIIFGEAICFADGLDFYEQKDSMLDFIAHKINSPNN